MATTGLFIHPNKIKAETKVDENVDEKIIINNIQVCQDMYIHTAIGTGLFNQIKTQIEGGTLSANNTTLLNTYIQPALKWWVLYEGMEDFNWKITNKAVVKKNADNTESVDMGVILHEKNKLRNRAEWYTERLRKYLIENDDIFTLFLNPGTGADIIHPAGLSYDTGWYLNVNDRRKCTDIDEFENPGTCCD